jgi:hypothetical protein
VEFAALPPATHAANGQQQWPKHCPAGLGLAVCLD